MQEIYGVGPCLRDACSASDLSDLFQPGSITQVINSIPEPSTFSALTLGLAALGYVAVIRRKRVS
jgi:hypothetical protein